MIFIIAQTLLMTGILPHPTASAKRHQHSLKIDMTPMVDLGFLLITFFIFKATLSQPGVTKLVMPAEGPPAGVAASRTLTLLLDKEAVFVYEGREQDALANGSFSKSNYWQTGGMGHSIRQKQKSLKDKNELMVLIRPLPGATYQNIITALDEMQINGVKQYAIVDASPAERKMTGYR